MEAITLKMWSEDKESASTKIGLQAPQSKSFISLMLLVMVKNTPVEDMTATPTVLLKDTSLSL